MSNAINSLQVALISALVKDLNAFDEPIMKYERSADGLSQKRVATGQVRQVRPCEDACEVYHFMQAWGSTALGFGGIGGQAITGAYTTVVCGPAGDSCVYFGGRFAYHVQKPNSMFYEHINRNGMLDVARHMQYESGSAGGGE